MYGGISLCIYINGVAQELLEMARATAVTENEGTIFATNELSASARIYRRLGQYLDSDQMDVTLLSEDHPAAPIRTRFVIDVLSGTSAGGLNSIFLAKALVNNANMEGLKRLWMEEGDINRLLNDKKSGLPGLPASGEPNSLLNSQRMYAQLLRALHVMDFPNDQEVQISGEEAQSAAAKKALVDELDLYVTATDLPGLPIHMKLENAVANELRHRSVFNFSYDNVNRNDFGWQFNPLLAFAGRCTSSIPPAFEPMRLEDTAPVLRARKPYRAMADAGSPKWSQVYSDYANRDETGDFRSRNFGDGGFLDNKPFTYATRALLRRQAKVPVQRKLIYIEPSPETLAPDPTALPGKPDAIAHSLAALVELPRYETIREDIEAVLDRNRLLERIDQVTRRVQDDVVTFRKKVITRVEGTAFEQKPLKVLIEELGIPYGLYHRLKVAEVTSRLADLISDLLDHPEESDECLAIRKLVEHWREAHYAEDPPPGKLTESRFLMDFDPGYRLRRLFFLHRKITFFYRFAKDSPQAAERRIRKDAGCPDPLPEKIAELFDSNDAASWTRFRTALLSLKDKLSRVVSDLRRVENSWQDDVTLKGHLRDMNLDKANLEKCLSDAGFVREQFEKHAPQFERASEHLTRVYENAFIAASNKCSAAFQIEAGLSEEEKVAREVLGDMYGHFDHYDMAIFPVQYGSDSFETPHVDILRVSPDDAKNLCDDTIGARRKLAGRMYFSFGAFFDKSWRANDMLWGRLDGAEILVRNLLRGTSAEKTDAATHPAFQGRLSPGESKTVADVIVDDLHVAILSEALPPERRNDVWKLLHQTLPTLDLGASKPEIREFVSNVPALGAAIQSIATFSQGDSELLSYYKTSYEVNRQLEPQILLRLFARGSQIMGRMLEAIALQRGKDPKKKYTTMVVRAAAIFSGLVELSVPRSPGEILWRYWRVLFYVMGGTLFALGLLVGRSDVQTGGILILIVTGVIHLTTWWLRLFMARWPWLHSLTIALISIFLAILLALGAWKVYELAALLNKHSTSSIPLRADFAGQSKS
jgi:patatin-related protein